MGPPVHIDLLDQLGGGGAELGWQRHTYFHEILFVLIFPRTFCFQPWLELGAFRFPAMATSGALLQPSLL